MKTPNFFIVGAPKCGTTALSEYLRQHSQIFVPSLKEPHFFATDFHKFRPYYVQTEYEYLHLFAGAREEHTAVGEASVWYLYSSTAAQNIYEFNPQAHIIALLRNPVEMVHALHSQYCFSLVEDVTDFETAWRLQEKRLNGMNIPRAVPPVDRCLELLQYGQIGKLGNQMQKLLQIFPRQQVKTIFFEDLKESTGDVYKNVLEFLGVPYDGRTNFPAINAHKTKRAYWIAHTTNNLKQRVNKYGIKNTGLFRVVNQVNTKHSARESLSTPFRNELIDFFEADIKLLASLTDRNLDHWLTKKAV